MRHREMKIAGGGRGFRACPGFTLTELIVVVALVGIMAGIAVPSMVRMGYFAKDDAKQTARELYAMLRAAKINAATYHVKTAVVYFRKQTEGMAPGDGYMNAAMMMQESKEESPCSGKFYVPISGTSGMPESFKGEACIVAGNPAEIGMTPVAARFEGEISAIDCEQLPMAHVFDPAGRLVTSAPLELYRLGIGYSPVADSAAPSESPTVGIELQKTTGRVRVVSDWN